MKCLIWNIVVLAAGIGTAALHHHGPRFKIAKRNEYLMNEGPKEVESSKELQRRLVIVMILTCISWIKVWADLAFGYVRWEGYLTACYAVFPVFLWVWIAHRHNKIDRRLADLSAVVLGVTVFILLALHILSSFF